MSHGILIKSGVLLITADTIGKHKYFLLQSGQKKGGGHPSPLGDYIPEVCNCDTRYYEDRVILQCPEY